MAIHLLITLLLKYGFFQRRQTSTQPIKIGNLIGHIIALPFVDSLFIRMNNRIRLMKFLSNYAYLWVNGCKIKQIDGALK